MTRLSCFIGIVEDIGQENPVSFLPGANAAVHCLLGSHCDRRPCVGHPPNTPPTPTALPPPPHFLHLPSPSPICDTQSQVDPVWIYCPFLDTAFVLTARFLSLLPPHGHLTLNSHLSPAPSFFLVKDTLTSSLLTVADLSAPMNPLALVFSQPAWH